jgi:hypothetical protein
LAVKRGTSLESLPFIYSSASSFIPFWFSNVRRFNVTFSDLNLSSSQEFSLYQVTESGSQYLGTYNTTDTVSLNSDYEYNIVLKPGPLYSPGNSSPLVGDDVKKTIILSLLALCLLASLSSAWKMTFKDCDTEAIDPTVIMNVDGSNPKLVESRGDFRKEAMDIYDHWTPEELQETYLKYIPQLGI